jgi:hypothetical protein
MIKIHLLFVFIFLSAQIFSQQQSLVDIQKDIINKKASLSIHYNKLVPIYEKKNDSLSLVKKSLERTYKNNIDSLLGVISINQSITETNRKQLNNYKKLSEIIENKIVCIISTKKENKNFVKLSKIDYPVKIFYQKNVNSYILISLDNENGFLLDIKEITNNKKASLFYNSLKEKRLFSMLDKSTLLDLTNSKIAVAAELIMQQTNLKITSVNKLKELELVKITQEQNYFNKNNLKHERIRDSILLSDLFDYYGKYYPNELDVYNKLLATERVKDKLLLENYNSALINYEKNVEYMSLNIEAEADKCFNWLKTEFNDPYSAIFEKYGLKTYPSISEKYPCAKIYLLTVRAKNGFGSYVPGKYLVVMIDGNPITGTEFEGSYLDAGNLSINLMLENVNCRNSNVTEPTKPITADERIPKPNMKEYNFKFSLN